ncbi:MAG: 30S ribosomal protein S3 [Microgenomates group bacterium GW2011_GWC1_38_14]|uniref:30S ribosomal protein S3 n=1 Tax=uncultured organism TaxID=155900 RepID=U3GVY4_9ZZZZ|nr:30S ribosomal protein S3 [uncultured organism]KKP95446.1 MAG: 30S ribosomal protein S3 [Candidatus Levybacteria bacterium GW2011_GWA2_36_13]KKQ00795.1 MAG: 30S ribosomal protein S3 [Candidatus Levybacteria bacterium GW2011_GWB1_36_18]KKQ58300.1 MAG: 30S ribosomal protein S3 [Microgenomates group bacterium GW2011_GWC1_38_14]KKR15893.1 MAG: 30S ribosomal protein S3 [Candidatus Levybacteria bacterium GW2011_GWA1_39_32]OGH43835.1 MAG: 30S ribosomal protein S3 [Candidatus Levybacteria bacterium 
MGHKVNPKLFRLGPLYNWDSRWFDDKKYKETLFSDYNLRKSLTDKLKHAGVSLIEIERSINSIKITAYVSKPGIVIGRGGAGLEELKKFINKIVLSNKEIKNLPKIDIRVEPIKEPNLDAYLVAKNISDQLIRRLPHKRLMAQAAERSMAAGAKGVRIILSGRIGGAEIGRREKIQQGTVPLSTIREHISFASVPALTKKGYIGVKVWINKNES